MQLLFRPSTKGLLKTVGNLSTAHLYLVMLEIYFLKRSTTV